MKHHIKYLIAIVAIIGLCFSASAQSSPRTLSGTPTSVATNTTWSTATSPAQISGIYPAAKDFALELNYKLGSDTGDSNITFTVQKSVSGANWQTLGTIVQASSGSNYVTWVTNYTLGAVGNVRIYSIANNNSVASGYITNLTVKWTAK